MIKAPKIFIEQALWPEFQELSAALVAYLSEITEKVIREEVHKETGEAEEVDEPTRIGRCVTGSTVRCCRAREQSALCATNRRTPALRAAGELCVGRSDRTSDD